MELDNHFAETLHKAEQERLQESQEDDNSKEPSVQESRLSLVRRSTKMLRSTTLKSEKSNVNPLLKPIEYYRNYWLPIKLEILPCILGWLKNSRKLWPGPHARETVSKNEKAKIIKLQIKIVEVLDYLKNLSRDRLLCNIFFSDDKDLR